MLWLWLPIHRRAHHAPIVWVVMWIVGDPWRPVGDCGHRHKTREEAFACPWEPDLLPLAGAGVVQWARDPDYRTIGELLRDARRPMVQLGMPWRAA